MKANTCGGTRLTRLDIIDSVSKNARQKLSRFDTHENTSDDDLIFKYLAFPYIPQ